MYIHIDLYIEYLSAAAKIHEYRLCRKAGFFFTPQLLIICAVPQFDTPSSTSSHIHPHYCKNISQ